MEDLLRRAATQRASDVHFEPTPDALRVRFRIDGVLHDVDRLPHALAENVIARLKVLAGLLTYRVDVPQEGAFRWDGPDGESTPQSGSSIDAPSAALDTRVATFPTIYGERAVVRLLPTGAAAVNLDDLGLAADMVAGLRSAAEQPGGLILITGPAGAGKSTTLYALARHILQVDSGRCVISLEDPVEQRVAGLTQIQIQPYGELNYVKALRSLLRQDVQVLLVGEIRDAATAHIVTEAALTGHLVMSTMHSGDPAECIARLLEMGVAPYQVVSALTLVATQRLVRRICPDCRATGCAACGQTGYQGRTACGAFADLNEPLRQQILRCAPAETLREIIAQRRGSLVDDAQRLLAEGFTTINEVRRALGTTVVWQSAPESDRTTAS